MSLTAKEQAGIRRQIKLPNSEAVKIAVRSLKIRFWRSLITAAGIVLAIAFLTYVVTAGSIESAMRAEDAPMDLAAMQKAATRIWLIAISLLICVVGISNAMLMSVTERYREIGTMKCLGALDWFVVKLFLIEAAFQGIAGSLVGAVIGVLAAVLAGMSEYGLDVFGSMPWGTLFLNIILALLVGAVLSTLGAIYPARRAGRMPPADAMRTEV